MLVWARGLGRQLYTRKESFNVVVPLSQNDGYYQLDIVFISKFSIFILNKNSF